MLTIAQRVEKIRSTMGLTLLAFAEVMTYDRNYIAAVEKGVRTPGPRFVRRLEELERELEKNQDEARIVGTGDPGFAMGGSPRNRLKRARVAAGMSVADLAKAIGYQIGVLQAVEDGTARASERMIEAITKVLPTLAKEDLMDGSDYPLLMRDDGRVATFGSKPTVALPPGIRGRYVPLLSWAQAGALDAGHVDEAYDYQAILALNITDPKAFALEIRGNSMAPELNEGDHAVVVPGWRPRAGDTVVVRTMDGDVFCKIYQPKDGGKVLQLLSHNPAHLPIELRPDDIAWIYPVAQVTKNMRRE
jgi:SOS-response transcriptional repressor LexA